MELYIIDPATSTIPITIYDWATAITDDECSYYLVRNNNDYIFNQSKITNDNWYKKDRQNYKWTVQGLAGINGVTVKGKAQLVFNKRKIQATEKAFHQLMKNKPGIIDGDSPGPV